MRELRVEQLVKVIAAAIELGIAQSEWVRRFEGQSAVEITNISIPYIQRIDRARQQLNEVVRQVSEDA